MRSVFKRFFVMLSAIILSASYFINPVMGATDAKKNSSEIITSYINFIKSQQSAISYLIYDVDKDGAPEVFIERQDPNYRAFVVDIYSFRNGKFEMLGTEFGAGGHVTPVFASYPDGDGVLKYSVHKGKELIELLKWVNGTCSEESVYLDDYHGRYYGDRFDQTYDDSLCHKKFINHQFYKSENSYPFYEGSLLLAQSSPADFTAVYEAFDGSGNAADRSRDDNKEQNSDEITIKTLKSFIGKQRSEIPYDLTSDITSPVWPRENCYETVMNPKMYGYEGKVVFQFKDNAVINAYWASGAVHYEDLNKIIQDIRKTTGLEEQESVIDELTWTDTSDHVQYYIKYHEAPLIIGVKKV